MERFSDRFIFLHIYGNEKPYYRIANYLNRPCLRTTQKSGPVIHRSAAKQWLCYDRHETDRGRV